MNQEQPPGWYADPGGERAVRWWDGQRWSADIRPTHSEGGSAFAGARQSSFPPAPPQPAYQGQTQQAPMQQAAVQQTPMQPTPMQPTQTQQYQAQQTQTQQYRPRHHSQQQSRQQQAGPSRPPYAQGAQGPVPGQAGPYGSGAYAQATQGMYSQPRGAQPQIPALLEGGPQHGARRRGRQPRGPWLARNKTVVAGIGGAIVLIGLVARFSTQESAQSPAAGTTAVGAAVSPVASAVAVASPSPSPKATAHTVATFTGSGSQNTPYFTVTSSWKLSYSFSCAALGESGTFQVSEDAGQDLSGLTVNDLAESKSSSASASNDAGKHYLAVASQCTWKLQVIDEP
jgi:Protein of unknown function (DUF2510)